jgi:GDPmannose 4,6-dehydratase
LKWVGEGIDEKGIDINTGKIIIEIDSKYYRPAEVDLLIGDYTKINKTLGWKPKTKFKELVEKMMKFDLK